MTPTKYNIRQMDSALQELYVNICLGKMDIDRALETLARLEKCAGNKKQRDMISLWRKKYGKK